MNKKEIYNSIFVEIFNVEVDVLDEKFNFNEVEEWDSLTHLTLITTLEDTFEIMFETEDILHFGGYLNGMRILEKYGIIFND